MNSTTGKADRLLQIYSRLVNGEILSKKEMADRFHITERSVQRDVEALRCYFQEEGMNQDVIHDRKAGGYRLQKEEKPLLNNGEILSVCKILLESRSMKREEMFPILEKLTSSCVPPKSRAAVDSLISNEKFHYIEPHHGKSIIPGLWDIAQAVQNHYVMEIEYERMKAPNLVKRTIEPVGILFSEYYFYLAAFLRNIDREKEFTNKDDIYPTIYRIDRIKSFKITDEHFNVPYKDRFEEGEFRKRVQFMYGGKLKKIRFKYTGMSVEAILDRLPTAKVIRDGEGGKVIEAEVFGGDGVDMWLKGQGSAVEMISE